MGCALRLLNINYPEFRRYHHTQFNFYFDIVYCFLYDSGYSRTRGNQKSYKTAQAARFRDFLGPIVADRLCSITHRPVAFDQWDLGNTYGMLLVSSSAAFSQNRLVPIIQSFKCERSK